MLSLNIACGGGSGVAVATALWLPLPRAGGGRVVVAGIGFGVAGGGGTVGRIDFGFSGGSGTVRSMTFVVAVGAVVGVGVPYPDADTVAFTDSCSASVSVGVGGLNAMQPAVATIVRAMVIAVIRPFNFRGSPFPWLDVEADPAVCLSAAFRAKGVAGMDGPAYPRIVLHVRLVGVVVFRSLGSSLVAPAAIISDVERRLTGSSCWVRATEELPRLERVFLPNTLLGKGLLWAVQRITESVGCAVILP